MAQTNPVHTEPHALVRRLTFFSFLQCLVYSKPQALTRHPALFGLEIWEQTSTIIESSPFSFI